MLIFVCHQLIEPFLDDVVNVNTACDHGLNAFELAYYSVSKFAVYCGTIDLPALKASTVCLNS